MLKRTKKAFTLIELLVVISIIALIGSGSVMLVNWNSGKQSLRTAQQQLMSAFEEARLLSCSKNARSRVLIYKGDDLTRKLRQVGLVYEYFDEDGNSLGWASYSNAIMLPKGVFFVPTSGEYNAYATLPETFKGQRLMYSTFRNGTTGAPSIVGISHFGSRKPQSMGEGNGDWYCYEFSPEGLSENPSAQIVVATGSLNASGKYVQSNPYDILGFRIVKSGKCVGFSDYAEIEGTFQ